MPPQDRTKMEDGQEVMMNETDMDNGNTGKDDDETKRETWGNKLEFILSLLGFAVGFGNIWRFPYLCFKNGGAVFLIPYFIMLFIAGLPLFFMELAIGQYVSLGPNILFQKLAPILSGLGWGMVSISLYTAVYFNVIISWSIFYIVASFASVLPWGHCNNYFNTPECFSEEANRACRNESLYYYNRSCVTVEDYCSEARMIAYNETHCWNQADGAVLADRVLHKITPSEDFYLNRMYNLGDSNWDDMGSLRWEMVGYLALAWVIVGASLIRGIKSLGKVVYFTATFPYIILVILLIRGITLEGSYQGIEFYLLKPNITKLMEIEVWNDAAIQIFYSLGTCFGSLITLSSYNKFDNNCMRHAFIVGLSNCMTSVFTGFVIFSILGFLSHELGVEIKDVASSGSGLVFVVYPTALALLPIPQLWSVLFFFMLICVGLSSQFSMVETVTTAIFDQFEYLRPKKPYVVCLICFGMLLLGISFCLEGGLYMFELFFWYSPGFSVIVIAVTEVVGIQVLFGFRNFLQIIEEMGISISFPMKCYWGLTWLITTPLSLIAIAIAAIYFFVPAYSGDYVFPQSIQILGWCLCISSLAFVPVGAIYACFKQKHWRDLFRSSVEFCPATLREELRNLNEKSTGGNTREMFRQQYDNEAFEELSVQGLKITLMK